MRKSHRIDNRITALFLTIVTIITSIAILVSTIVIPASAAADDLTVRDDALHFIIRHWHTDYDSDAKHQTQDAQKEGDDWFVVVEGYILPNRNPDPENNYDIYLVNQDSGDLVKVSELTGDEQTPYLGAFDKTEGTLELKVKSLRDNYDGTDLEKFCGISLSAGRGAVNFNKDGEGTTTGITIRYSANTHLVKGHVFYSTWNKTVPGSSDPAVFDPERKEIDAAEVYTYKADGTIVKNGDDVCRNEEDLEKAGITDLSSVELTKFYSTNEGLHTNKTLVQQDGRTFLADLEAWYIEGHAAQIGFILDASGSMAFTSDNPDKINVYDVLAKRLDIELNESGNYAYKNYQSEAGEELKDFIERLAADRNEGGEGLLNEFLATISDKICRAFTEEHWNTLFAKKGIANTLQEETFYAYPQHDKLIGYYEIQDNKGSGSYANYRTWFLNSIVPADSNGNIYRNPSSYSYDNANADDFSKMVTYNENGSSFDFSNQETLIDYGSYGGWGNVPINFNNTLSSHRTYGMNLRQASAGFMPNAKPSSNQFTVSFSLDNTYDTKASFLSPLEILYVGEEAGDKSAGGYLRVTREGGDFKIYNGHNVLLYTLSGAFGTDESNSAAKGRQRFTFTINGESVEFYANNTLKTIFKVPGLSGNTIVFAPFLDTHESSNDANTGPLMYLDDIFVYDTNLSANDVAQLMTAYNVKGYTNGKATNIDDKKTERNWNMAFLADDVLPLLLNPHSTAHTPLGVAAYNYFVFDASDTTKEYSPLAYWNGSGESEGSYTKALAGDSTLGSLEQGTRDESGWYYLTHGTDKPAIETLKTAKRLIGLGPYTVYDYADTPGKPLGESGDGSGNGFLPDGNTSIRFYIDENGYLRCFFSRNISTDKTHNVACSYVYELPDNKYVKTEALQRVLANFSSKLSERSPTSKISAVKFSANWSSEKELKNLVLLDWTDNSEEIASIMSQKRGQGEEEGTAAGVDVSEHGMKQYNYVLTGGTYAYTGLLAYKQMLSESESLDPNAPKFLVVFTDGVDNSLDKGNEAVLKQTYDLADEFKNKGYTIITVYLPCGPAVDDNGQVDEENSEYKKAKEFLCKVGGTSEGDDGEEYFFASNNLPVLQNLFEEKILAEIVDKMEGYTVQDYIDPRFDLKNADGTLWKLNAGGNVDRIYENGKTETISVPKGDPKTGKPYVFHLSGDTTPSARNPYLHYNAKKDMYYLEWLDQTIPSTPIGSKTLMPVWNAEVYLRAKDDFIGGNAVLTNGNEKNMNWVFHPADISQEAYNAYYDGWDEDENGKIKISSYDACSGTDDMYKLYEKIIVDGVELNNYNKPIDEFPSKGFPRVTANVELLPIVTNDLNGVIFLGEAISPRQLLTQVKDEYITDSYYLEYIKRYAYQRYIKASSEEAKLEMDMPLLDLLTKWLEIDNDEIFEKEFSVPYIYLPSVQYNDDTGKVILDEKNRAIITNSTGTDINKRDVLGILTYHWEQLDPKPTEFYEPIKDFVKSDTERVIYSLTVEYTPLKLGDTLEILNEAAIGGATETTPEGISIILADEEESGTETEARARAGIFAKYVPMDPADDLPGGGKTEFTEDFGFERESYVNDKLIDESYYKWDRNYKPACPEEQQLLYPEGTPEGETPADGAESTYGDATFLNHGRTLTAFSKNTLDVVSGDIIPELRMLIGELEELADYKNMANGAHFISTITLSATRSFTDTDIVEKIKQQNKENGEAWEDYGKEFIITFELDYTKEDIKALRDSLDEPGADPDGYVSVFAKMKEIKAYFGSEPESSITADDYSQIKELPIGTYTFSLSNANSDAALGDMINKLHFASMDYEHETERYDDAHDYFNGPVLRGLNTTNEYPELKYRKIGEVGGMPIYDMLQEIGKGSTAAFIAEAESDKKTATFYVGTSPTDAAAHRGNASKNIFDPERYTYDRLGIMILSTGSTLLTVIEDGAERTESFLYRITGETLGGKPVDLVISVEGSFEPGTTIEILPGNYTVTEISDWSWKYDNKDTYDKNYKDSTDETGKYSREKGDWDVTTSDFKSAYTELRYRDDKPILEHHHVIFEHKRNEKVWLGGESHFNNHFLFENDSD